MTVTEDWIRGLADKAGRPIEDWQIEQFVRLYIQRLVAPTGYLPGAPVGPREFPRDPVPFRHPVQQHRYNVWLNASYPGVEFEEQASLEALDLEADARTQIADQCDFIRDHTNPPPAWLIPDDPFPGRGWTDAEPDRTSQPRIPKPSMTPPMWVNDVNRSRRPRKNRNQPTRQGIQ